MICPALLAIALLASSAWAERYPVVLTAWSPLLEYQNGTSTKNNMTASWTPALVGSGRQSTNAYTGEQVVWTRYMNGEPELASVPNRYFDYSGRPSLRCQFYGSGIKFHGYWNDPTNDTDVQAELELRNGQGLTRFTGKGGFGTEPVVLAETALMTNEFNEEVVLYVNRGAISITAVEVMLPFPDGLNRTTIESGEAQAYSQSHAMRNTATKVNGSTSVIYTVDGDDNLHTSMNPTLSAGLDTSEWMIDSATNHSIVTDTIGARLQFSVNSGNLFLRINGTVGKHCGGSKVAISPSPPWGVYDVGAMKLSDVQDVPDHEATICFAVLDANVSYTITVTNLGVHYHDPSHSPGDRYEPRRLGIHSIELWMDHTDPSIRPPPRKARVGAGPIAGGVVGGVAGLAAIGILIFVCVRRSRKRRSGHGGEKGEPFEVDDQLSENGHMSNNVRVAPNSNMKVKGRMAPGPVVRNLRRGKRIPHRQLLKHGNGAEGLGSSAEPGSSQDTANVNASGSNAPLGPVRIVCQEEDAGVLQPTSPNTTRRLGPPTYSARPDTLLTLNPVDDGENDEGEGTGMRTATTSPNPVEIVDSADSRRGSGERQPNTDRS